MLSIIQMKLFDYICQNVQNEYVGDYVTEERVKNLFRVTDLRGTSHVMEIVLSRRSDHQVGRSKKRSFRSIITVFFRKEKTVRISPNFVPKL